MTWFAEKFHVESSRLKNWDYSTPGIYFITICAVYHNKFFGKIINNQIALSDKGNIVKEELLKTFEVRKNIKLHEYVIMPNHVHMLMEIINDNLDRDVLQQSRDVACYVSTNTENELKYFSKISPRSNTVSSTIRSFKSAVTKRINQKKVFFGWQPRFYDQIIKYREEYLNIKKYTRDNPDNWLKDPFHR
jgi:putative transposase